MEFWLILANLKARRPELTENAGENTLKQAKSTPPRPVPSFKPYVLSVLSVPIFNFSDEAG